CLKSKNQIIYENDITVLENVDAILVLGAGIQNNEPSLMLKDRLNKAIQLYQDNVASKIIMSGDHSRENYDEVNVMKDYAINKNVLSEDIFMDHAGFSTYESIYRAKEIFHAEKIVIVTQKYHLYRALYIANQLGIEAYGIAAEDISYSGEMLREAREIFARNKDFIKCIFKPEPTFLGDSISLSGSGDITNDK
ncbi:MAG: vancomycin high temperature exclusion protein, partial [Traorella sp.]